MVFQNGSPPATEESPRCSLSWPSRGIVSLFNFGRPGGRRDPGLELALCYGPSCLPGLPKMEVCQEYYGLPPPPGAFGPFLRLSPGDIVELTKAEAEQNWWEVQAGAVRVLEKHSSVGSWA